MKEEEPIAAPPQLVDPSRPVLAQVARLDPAEYLAWVHGPTLPGAPRFFASGAAEALSRTRWWVVPALWVPVVAALAAWAAHPAGGGLAPAPAAALFAAGLAAWQAAEYGLHRWVFHRAPRVRGWQVRLHFTLHGCHHKFPADPGRLVFPPAPAAALAAATAAALRAALPPAAAAALLAGGLAGYVAYDCTHFAMHSGARVPGRAFARLKRRHLAHHAGGAREIIIYGITSTWIDALLRTGGGAAKAA